MMSETPHILIPLNLGSSSLSRRNEKKQTKKKQKKQEKKKEKRKKNIGVSLCRSLIDTIESKTMFSRPTSKGVVPTSFCTYNISATCSELKHKHTSRARARNSDRVGIFFVILNNKHIFVIFSAKMYM